MINYRHESNEYVKDKIIKTLMSINRTGIEKVVDYLKESEFFEAPASTRHHLCCKGGLALHSLKVYETFKELNITFNLGFSHNTIAITALLHDICKIGIYKESSEGKYPYEYDDIYPIGHGEKSLVILKEIGLETTKEEDVLIRWHMGNFDVTYLRNQKSLGKYFPKHPFLFIADYISALKGF